MIVYDFENKIVIKDDKPFPFMCLSEKEQSYVKTLISENEKLAEEQQRILLHDCPF
jgi:hypothetical protein